MIEAELASSRERILAIVAGDDCTGLQGETVAHLVPDTSQLRQHLLPTAALSDYQISERQKEVKSIISSYEQRVGEDYDLGITLGEFAESAPLRLTAVTFFSSGAVSFVGLDALGRSTNMYDTLDHFSIILKKVRRNRHAGPRAPIEFYKAVDD